MTLPSTPLLSRALIDAIALCDGALRGGISCREALQGQKPSEVKARMEEYQKLLVKLTPSNKEVPRGETTKQ